MTCKHAYIIEADPNHHREQKASTSAGTMPNVATSGTAIDKDVHIPILNTHVDMQMERIHIVRDVDRRLQKVGAGESDRWNCVDRLRSRYWKGSGYPN